MRQTIYHEEHRKLAALCLLAIAVFAWFLRDIPWYYMIFAGLLVSHFAPFWEIHKSCRQCHDKPYTIFRTLDEADRVAAKKP